MTGFKIDWGMLLQLRASVDEQATVVPYVCMPGSPYTGSTLLGFLLNSHPDCVSIGAATGLTARVDIANYRCSCGIRFEDCDFWKQVAFRTEELGYPVSVFESDFWNTHVKMSQRRWLNGLLVRSLGNDLLTDARDALLWRMSPIRRTVAEAQWSTWSLARAVLDVSGKTVFVDTARDHQRPKYLAPSRMLDVKVIHLVRDPRGNVASIMKHTGVDVAKASKQWKHYNLEADRVRRFLPPESWMLLRYEDLCSDPQAALDRIARFVGIPPAPVSQDLQARDNHIIGNSMRLKAIGDIRQDETWRERLTDSDLDTIARISGTTSHRFGFDWP